MSERVAAVLIDPATGAPYTAIPVNIGSTVNRTASGNITSTQNVALSTAACGSAAFQVAGTWTDTLVFEYTIDDVTWHSLSVEPDSGGAAVSSTTTNGNWSVQVESYSQVRVRGNTVGSGTAAVFLSASTSTSVVSIASPLPVGDNTIGRVKITDGTDVADVTAVGALSVDASASVSLPLPTGAATLAEQQAQTALQGSSDTFLSSIDGKTPSLGQALMAASVPVAIASNQSAVPVSGTVAVSNAFALDATLTGGTQRTKITDGTNNAAVLNAAPTTDYGLVVRNVPAAATAPSAVQLSDGSASYTATKTGQLPIALGATTKSASLSVAPATDSVGTAGSASSTVYTVQGVASMTALQVTPPAGIGQQTLANSISVGLNSSQVGTAGSAATTVLSVQGIASGTNLNVAQATASALNATVVGSGSAGSAASGVVTVQGIASMTPVQVSQATASSLNAAVVGAGASGAAVSGNPVLTAGSDGTNARTLATDTAGRLRPAVYSYGRVTSLSSTTIKSGAGILRTVNIQYTGVAHSLVLYDNTASSGTQIAAITIPVGSALVSLNYNLAFTTGLTAQFGTAAGDVTIMYE